LIGVIQRVDEASVWVEGNLISSIRKGILLLLGIARDDADEDMEYIVNKTINLRIFSDENGNLNLSLLDISGELMIVSQFTLLGDTRKGRRPSFTNAMPPDKAEPFYQKVVNRFEEQGIPVKKGVFGAMMKIKLINDGPVTIILNSRDKIKK